MSHHHNAQEFWETHHQGYSQDVDWSSMKRIAKTNRSIHKRVQMMKIMHAMFMFQHRKVNWGLCQPCTNVCAFCGKHGETQEHVLHCTHTGIAQIKKKLQQKIGSEIIDNMDDTHKEDMPEGMLPWIEEHVPSAWNNSGSDIPPTYDSTIDNCIEEMQRKGAESSWAGMIHKSSVALVTHMTGLGYTSARTVAINIQTHINDTIVEIHQAARDMKRPIAPTPASYTLDEQEDQLDALDLLLTGAETMQQYRSSHINRRRNTVNKRLKLRGDAVDYLPPIGSEIRTYAQGSAQKPKYQNTIHTQMNANLTYRGRK